MPLLSRLLFGRYISSGLYSPTSLFLAALLPKQPVRNKVAFLTTTIYLFFVLSRLFLDRQSTYLKELGFFFRGYLDSNTVVFFRAGLRKKKRKRATYFLTSATHNQAVARTWVTPTSLTFFFSRYLHVAKTLRKLHKQPPFVTTLVSLRRMRRLVNNFCFRKFILYRVPQTQFRFLSALRNVRQFHPLKFEMRNRVNLKHLFKKFRRFRYRKTTLRMRRVGTRRYRFVKKYRAFLKYTTLHTNMFFLAQQGNIQVRVTTGMFSDLRHGTKRKRTLLAGWFLADRLADIFEPQMHARTVFFADFFGRTSGRRGVWYSWRTHKWRLVHVSSRTPIAYNGTRGCRRRRL